MKNKAINHIVMFLVLVIGLIIPFKSQAIDYYVDQNHPSASDQNIGTMTLPWKTIIKANQSLAAGDTVHIKEGNYTSYIAPNSSGTSSARITYKNFETENVTIQNTTRGIHLNGKSYITVQGINFYNLDTFLWLENAANHNVISYCNFDKSRTIGWSGSKIYLNSSYNWIHHNRFSKYGACQNGSDDGALLDVGNEESQTDKSNYNLIENNTMFHSGHHSLGVFGMYNIVRNNRLHNEAWTNGKGNRNLYLNGYPANSGWNLIEGNDIGYSYVPCDSWGVSGFSLATGYNIIRKNRFFYNDLAGIEMSTTSNYYSDIVYNKIYNNTFMRNGWNMTNGPDVATSAIALAVYDGPHIVKYNAIKNNLYYSHYQVYGAYRTSLGDQTLAGNWDGDTQGNPLFLNASTSPGDPMSSVYPSLNLQSSSPAIDAGTYLTTISSASGKGNVFQVADSRYFIDGWGIIQGDIIQIIGTTQKAKITNINYSTHTIMLDTALTWTKDQGISLAYEGTYPDIGAYEFLSGRLPIAPRNISIQ